MYEFYSSLLLSCTIKYYEVLNPLKNSLTELVNKLAS